MRLTTKNINWQLIPGLANKKRFDLSVRIHTIEEVAEAVVKHLDLSVAHLKVKTRKREIVEARQIVGYICTKLIDPHYTCKKVSSFFFQNHATVVNGNRSVENLINTDKNFKYKATIIFKSLDL